MQTQDSTTSVSGNGLSSLDDKQVASGATASFFDSSQPRIDPAASSATLKGVFAERVEDGLRLLEYAAESGIETDEAIRTAILKAKLEIEHGLSVETAGKLLSAVTQLAAKTRPVTGASLKTCADEDALETGFYIRFAAFLMALIIPYSVVSFVSAGLIEKVRQDVTVANALAVKLTDLLQPPQPNYSGPRGLVKPLPSDVPMKDLITDLQLFAGTIRTIDGRTQLLNWLVANSSSDRLSQFRRDPERLREKLELPRELQDIPKAAGDKIQVYQDIRYFAQNAQERVSLFYGAMATHILPMLYALLGSCAYLARQLEAQIKAKTFKTANRHLVHFLIAGIGGLIVGMFTFSSNQTASLPPLAIAFLAGYAVDVFYSALESLIKSFNRGQDQQAVKPGSQ